MMKVHSSNSSVEVTVDRICHFHYVSLTVHAIHIRIGQVYILKKAEGGRHTPFVNNYSPQLFARTADVNVSMMLPKVREIWAGFCVCLHLALPSWTWAVKLPNTSIYWFILGWICAVRSIAWSCHKVASTVGITTIPLHRMGWMYCRRLGNFHVKIYISCENKRFALL